MNPNFLKIMDYIALICDKCKPDRHCGQIFGNVWTGPKYSQDLVIFSIDSE